MENNLPLGWALTAISNLFEINPGHKGLSIDDNLKVTFLPMTSIEEVNGKIDATQAREYKEIKNGYTKFKEEDVLFAKITPCMENGKIAIANNLINGLGCGTTELHVLRPIINDTNKYLFYYLVQEKFRVFAKSKFNGAVGHLRVPSSIFHEINFPLPPLAEQKRIIAKLDALMEKVDSCKKRLEKIRAYTGKILYSFLKDRNGKDYSRDILKPYLEEGRERIGKEWINCPKIGVSAKEGIIDLDTGQKESFENYKIVKPGDFIYNAMRVNIGSIAIYEGDTIAITSPDYIVFRVKHTLSSLLLLLYLKSQYGLKEINSNTQGSVRSRLYFKHLCNIRYPIAPESHQKNAELILQWFSSLTRKQHEINNILEKLSQSILSKAFRGELVAQDPNDEPASVLIECIQQEKSGKGKANKPVIQQELFAE